MMKIETEIRQEIKEIERSSDHVLRLPCATVVENAPRALMQIEAQSRLSVLHWVLGEKRPKYKCDEVDE